MVDIQRQRVLWSGFPGGPGVSTHYFIDAALHQSALHTFYTALAAQIPDDVQLDIEAGGDTIETTTGALTGAWAGTTLAAVHGAASIGHPAPAGFEVQWFTDTILSGHRLRGRTFIVPADAGAYWKDGGLTAAVTVTMGPAVSALVSAHAANMVIWQRPRTATPAWTDRRGKPHAALTARAGGHGPVTSGVIPNKVVVLTSRRD